MALGYIYFILVTVIVPSLSSKTNHVQIYSTGMHHIPQQFIFMGRKEHIRIMCFEKDQKQKKKEHPKANSFLGTTMYSSPTKYHIILATCHLFPLTPLLFDSPFGLFLEPSSLPHKTPQKNYNKSKMDLNKIQDETLNSTLHPPTSSSTSTSYFSIRTKI